MMASIGIKSTSLLAWPEREIEVQCWCDLVMSRDSGQTGTSVEYWDRMFTPSGGLGGGEPNQDWLFTPRLLTCTTGINE